MSDSDNEIGSFLTGFIIGGLVGAAVALISAPQSGEETRAQIRERSIEIRDRAVENVEEVRHRAEEAGTQARHRAEELAEEARTRAEHLAHDARERAEDLQQRGRTVLGEQRERLEAAIDAGKKAAQTKKGQADAGNNEKPATSAAS